MANANNSVTWEYAQNFTENEKRWQEAEKNLKVVCLIFAKNTMLQLVQGARYMDILEMTNALMDGDRGEYLYRQIQSTVDEIKETPQFKETYDKYFNK